MGCIFICSLVFWITVCRASEFAEELLTLKVMNHDQLYAAFNFTVVSGAYGKAEDHHYNRFPRNIGDLVLKYNVSEFHLSMSQGLWRYEAWGYPYFPAPPGAQLWVWFSPGTVNVDASWQGFANALSGLLCASLNFIGKTETAKPVMSFRPEGVVPDMRPDLVRHAVLPRETLCTENLTPWLKLLPCGSHVGISSLFNPATLHHGRYLSLALEFKRACVEPNCRRPSMHLSQSVSVVFDLRKSTERPDFTLQSILQKKVNRACPLTRSSSIRISVPDIVRLSPAPAREEDGFHVYDLKEQPELRDILAEWNANVARGKKIGPPFVAHCHLTGIGQQDGGTRCHLTNKQSRDVSVVVMQTVPWFLQVYLHTLAITDQNGQIIPKSHFTFRPAKIRESPHFIEFLISVPAKSTVAITMQFTRGFLTWTEHPPDANHGFYIGSTVITVRKRDIGLEESNSGPIHRLYTEAIQVVVPVPDFSMPYNVICLVCTVIAVAFGSVHNETTRLFQKLDPDDENRGMRGKLARVWNSVLARFRKREPADGAGDRLKNLGQESE